MKSLEKDVFKRCGLEARAAIKDSEGAQPRDGGEPSPAGNGSQATARERGDRPLDRPPVAWRDKLPWAGKGPGAQMSQKCSPNSNILRMSSTGLAHGFLI